MKPWDIPIDISGGDMLCGEFGDYNTLPCGKDSTPHEAVRDLEKRLLSEGP